MSRTTPFISFSLALILLFQACLTDVAHAHLWGERRLAMTPQEAISSAAMMSDIPTFQNHFEALNSSKKTVILVQDVHLNREAQQDISNSLQALLQQRRVDLVALEGAFGQVNVGGFHRAPDESIVRHTADYFLRENLISGAMHAAVISRPAAGKQAVPVFGIDDQALYEANVQAYLQSRRYYQRNMMLLRQKHEFLAAQKKSHFNRQLLEFDEVVADHHHDRLSFGDYVHAMALRSPSLPPSLRKFLRALSLEAALKPDLLNADPDSDAFKAYLKLVGEFDGEEILKEVRQLEKNIYFSLVKTRREAALVAQSRKLFLTEKLLNFSLTKQEWSLYQNDPTFVGHFVLAPFKDFYRHAVARDEAMATSLFSAMEKVQARTAVLVAGGFHAEGLRRYAEQADINLIAVAPKINPETLQPGAAYLSTFLPPQPPVDNLIAADSWFLAPRQTTQLPSLAMAVATLHPNPQRTLQEIAPLADVKFVSHHITDLGVVAAWQHVANDLMQVLRINRSAGLNAIESVEVNPPAQIGSWPGRAMAVLSLVVFAPLILILAPLTQIGSQGPVFFVQQRLGFRGKIINVYKLRTMNLDGNVTWFGRHARRLGLDELPQIFNVINGSMQWFGPRPLVPSFISQDFLPDYLTNILSRTKPGIFSTSAAHRGFGLSGKISERDIQFDLDDLGKSNWYRFGLFIAINWKVIHQVFKQTKKIFFSLFILAYFINFPWDWLSMSMILSGAVMVLEPRLTKRQPPILYIPADAPNAIDDQTLKLWLKKLESASIPSLANERAMKLVHRIRYPLREVVMPGGIVDYPFGGADISPFILSGEITDVISQGIDPWGTEASFKYFLNPENEIPQWNFPMPEDFDAWNIDIDSSYRENLVNFVGVFKGLGPVVLARLHLYLGVTVRGLYFFDLDDQGKPVFKGRHENSLSQCGVIEFEDKHGRLKRYWYIQHDIRNDADISYQNFKAQLRPQILLIKASLDFFGNPLYYPAIRRDILSPIQAASKDGLPTLVLTDGFSMKGQPISWIWRNGHPERILVLEGQVRGYSHVIHVGDAASLTSTKRPFVREFGKAVVFFSKYYLSDWRTQGRWGKTKATLAENVAAPVLEELVYTALPVLCFMALGRPELFYLVVSLLRFDFIGRHAPGVKSNISSIDADRPALWQWLPAPLAVSILPLFFMEPTFTSIVVWFIGAHLFMNVLVDILNAAFGLKLRKASVGVPSHWKAWPDPSAEALNRANAVMSLVGGNIENKHIDISLFTDLAESGISPFEKAATLRALFYLAPNFTARSVVHYSGGAHGRLANILVDTADYNERRQLGEYRFFIEADMVAAMVELGMKFPADATGEPGLVSLTPKLRYVFSRTLGQFPLAAALELVSNLSEAAAEIIRSDLTILSQGSVDIDVDVQNNSSLLLEKWAQAAKRPRSSTSEVGAEGFDVTKLIPDSSELAKVLQLREWLSNPENGGMVIAAQFPDSPYVGNDYFERGRALRNLFVVDPDLAAVFLFFPSAGRHFHWVQMWNSRNSEGVTAIEDEILVKIFDHAATLFRANHRKREHELPHHVWNFIHVIELATYLTPAQAARLAQTIVPDNISLFSSSIRHALALPSFISRETRIIKTLLNKLPPHSVDVTPRSTIQVWNKEWRRPSDSDLAAVRQYVASQLEQDKAPAIYERIPNVEVGEEFRTLAYLSFPMAGAYLSSLTPPDFDFTAEAIEKLEPALAAMIIHHAIDLDQSKVGVKWEEMDFEPNIKLELIGQLFGVIQGFDKAKVILDNLSHREREIMFRHMGSALLSDNLYPEQKEQVRRLLELQAPYRHTHQEAARNHILKHRVLQPQAGHVGQVTGVLVVIDGLTPERNEIAALNEQHIVALEYLPARNSDLGPLGGLLTFQNEDETSHALKRVEGWTSLLGRNVPHAFWPGPDYGDLKLLNGQVVTLTVGAQRVDLRRATELEKEAYENTRKLPALKRKAYLPGLALGDGKRIFRSDNANDLVLMRNPEEVSYKVARTYAITPDHVAAVSEEGIEVQTAPSVVFPARFFNDIIRRAGLRQVHQKFLAESKDSEGWNSSRLNFAKAILRSTEVLELIKQSLVKEGLQVWVQKGVFLRICTNAEDNPDMDGMGSGIHPTYPNIVDLDDAAHKIRRGFAEVFNKTAILDRKKYGVDEALVMPVVWVVPSQSADYSFIMNTSHLTSEQMMVEIIQGFWDLSEEEVGHPTRVVWNRVVSENGDAARTGKHDTEYIKAPHIGMSQIANKIFKAVLNPAGGLMFIRPEDMLEFLYYFKNDRWKNIVRVLAKLADIVENQIGPGQIEGTMHVTAEGRDVLILLNQNAPHSTGASHPMERRLQASKQVLKST
jgi:hypothetical protein